MSTIVERRKKRKVNSLSTYYVTDIHDNNHFACVYMCLLWLKEIAGQRILAEVHNSSTSRPFFIQEGEIGYRKTSSRPQENSFYVSGTRLSPLLLLRWTTSLDYS